MPLATPTTLRIFQLKQMAKRYYTMFHSHLERVSCGAAMLKNINGSAANAATQFNLAMIELEKIDPKCPKWEKL